MSILFASLFVCLYIGHTVGDHWVQTGTQAAQKATPGWGGRIACASHVLSLTVTKAVIMGAVVIVLDLELSAWGVVGAFAVDAGSHYWADRRFTLARLASSLGKREFYALGSADHEKHPVDQRGEPAATLGTGAYALDQSWHIFWLGVAALIIAGSSGA